MTLSTTPTMDDQTLLRRFAHGSSEEQRQSAFTELVNRHVNWVYASALRQVGDPALADDVTQAAFVLLWRKAGSLGERTRLAGWLFQATRNLARDAIKLRRRRITHEHKAAMMNPTISEAHADLWPDMAPALDRALASLGPTDRDAVVLRYLRQLSLEELADALSISQAAARKRVERAMDRLRSILRLRGVTAPVSAIAAALLAHAAPPAPASVAAAAALPTSASATAQALATAPQVWATKVKAVAVAMGVVLVAVNVALFLTIPTSKQAAPAGAAVPPPPPQAASELSPAQQAREAMANSRTIYLTYTDVEQQTRVWFDAQRGIAFTHGDSAVWTINNGTHQWHLTDGATVAGRSRSVIALSRLRDVLIGWMVQMIQNGDLERHAPADQVIEGVAGTAYRVIPPDPNAGEPLLAWFDPQHRLLQAAIEEVDEPELDEPMFRFTYDAPVPEGLFEIEDRENMRVIDTDAWLAEAFPLDEAAQRMDVLGSHVTVHAVRRGEGGDVFLAIVTRLTDRSLREAPPSLMLIPSVGLSHMAAEAHPGLIPDDLDTHRAYRLGAARGETWVVGWYILVPNAQAARADRCTIGIELNASGLIHDWLTERGLPVSHAARIELDLRDAPPSSLDQITRQLHAQASEIGPALHWFGLAQAVSVMDGRGREFRVVPVEGYKLDAYQANVAEALKDLRRK